MKAFEPCPSCGHIYEPAEPPDDVSPGTRRRAGFVLIALDIVMTAGCVAYLVFDLSRDSLQARDGRLFIASLLGLSIFVDLVVAGLRGGAAAVVKEAVEINDRKL